jgi:enediyne biosynthesis protein E4
VAGNLGLNSQAKASKEEPAEIYYSDFDNNGSVDPILCFYIQGKRYPYVSFDELQTQLPSYRKKFQSYGQYSTAQIEDVIPPGQLAQAAHRASTEFRTCLFSLSGGKFIEKVLPIESQISPVHAILVGDFTKDGIPDIVLAGNEAKARMRFGKYDANMGILLRGKEALSFQYVQQPKSGLRINGDVRSICTIQTGSKRWMLLGMNNAPMLGYRID